MTRTATSTRGERLPVKPKKSKAEKQARRARQDETIHQLMVRMGEMTEAIGSIKATVNTRASAVIGAVNDLAASHRCQFAQQPEVGRLIEDARCVYDGVKDYPYPAGLRQEQWNAIVKVLHGFAMIAAENDDTGG